MESDQEPSRQDPGADGGSAGAAPEDAAPDDAAPDDAAPEDAAPAGAAPDDATALARRIAERIAAGSRHSRALGIRTLEVTPGRAVLEMTVTDEHANWHGTCHGGAIATLADTAFGYACQSSGEAMVAAGFDITFVAPAGVGRRLVAVGLERIRYGRSGLVDVTVFDGDPEHGRVVAELRGRSRSLGRSALDPVPQPLPPVGGARPPSG